MSNDKFELLDGSYSVTDIQFWVSHQKTWNPHW